MSFSFARVTEVRHIYIRKYAQTNKCNFQRDFLYFRTRNGSISNTFCFKFIFSRTSKHIHTQECIPLGCVPAAHWLYAGGEVCFPGGCLLPGGACSQEGGLPPGGYPSMHWGRPPVNRITDMSKNITLAPTSLRSVKILLKLSSMFLSCSQVGSKFIMNARKSLLTRMHSSGMHTARSSGRPRGSPPGIPQSSAPGAGTP